MIVKRNQLANCQPTVGAEGVYLDLAPAKKPGFWRKLRRETLKRWLRNPVSVPLLSLVQEVGLAP